MAAAPRDAQHIFDFPRDRKYERLVAQRGEHILESRAELANPRGVGFTRPNAWVPKTQRREHIVAPLAVVVDREAHHLLHVARAPIVRTIARHVDVQLRMVRDLETGVCNG